MPIVTVKRDSLRTRKIRQKYGVNAFRTWGKRGGNKLLIAQGKGYKITIHKP